MEERNRRTSLQGVVTGTKMAKTIIVTVSTKRNDPLYKKRVGYSKKYYAHDENEQAKLGDEVTIMACRPLSRLKRWRLVSIDKAALAGESVEAIEAALEKKEGSDEIVTAPAEEAKAE
ncbi:MAG: 30S ribosomal protein S17 [Bacilli bacterium]|nr:30S ribosomal protein S17 [Bacilli bacterium]